MAHTHGNEYQVKIIHANGTEQLSGWLASEDQIPQVMSGMHMTPGKTYWLQRRDAVCPQCLDGERSVLEVPLTHVSPPRCSQSDSRYSRW